MKRSAVPTVLAAVAALCVTSPAGAQYVFFGGGPTKPMGDFKDVDNAKTGYTFLAGLGTSIGTSGLFIEAEVGRGSNSHANTGNLKEKTNVISAFGALGYSFGATEKKVRPYLLGGAGIVAHQFRTDAPPPNGEGTESKFGVTGAGGITISLNTVASVWLEGRWIGSKGTSLVGLLLGLQFGH
jgi:hypothetical protein